MGRTRIRASVLVYVAAAGLFSCLLSACGGDKGIVEPKPPASLGDLFGPVLYKADGSSVSIDAVEGKLIVGIYFSAWGCPACGAFTPVLVNTYAQLQQAGKSFEVVYVSLEASSEDMFAYMTDFAMPWLAVPFGSAKAEALTRRYDVRWIPTLIVVDGEGKTISKNGRDEVAAMGSQAYDGWLSSSGAP